MEILTLFQSLPIKPFTRGWVIPRAAFSDQKDIDFRGFYTFILYDSILRVEQCFTVALRELTSSPGWLLPLLAGLGRLFSGVVKSKCAAVWNGRSVTRLSKNEKKTSDFIKRRCDRVPEGNVLTVISQAQTRMMFLFRSLERMGEWENAQPPLFQKNWKRKIHFLPKWKYILLEFQIVPIFLFFRFHFIINHTQSSAHLQKKNRDFSLLFAAFTQDNWFQASCEKCIFEMFKKKRATKKGKSQFLSRNDITKGHAVLPNEFLISRQFSEMTGNCTWRLYVRSWISC